MVKQGKAFSAASCPSLHCEKAGLAGQQLIGVHNCSNPDSAACVLVSQELCACGTAL